MWGKNIAFDFSIPHFLLGVRNGDHNHSASQVIKD
jgi:hypothetical protein